MTSMNRLSLLCALLGAGIVWGCGGSNKGVEGGPAGGIDGGNPVTGTGGVVGGGGTPAVGGGGNVGAGGTAGVTMALPTGGIVAAGGGPGGALGTGGTTIPACGQAGMNCCDGNTCNGGGCCVSGICLSTGGSCIGLGGGICNNGSCGSCGGPGQPCCGSNPAVGVCTAPNTACNNGSCSTCGELGSLCCPGASGGAAKCNSSNAICTGNVCLACGTPGSQCCPGNRCASPGCCYDNVCASEGAACGSGGGTCQAGRCSGCGGADQPCCTASQCYDGLLCKTGSCTPCGGMGQTCCPASAATSTCQSGSACTSDGVCARCGSLGDICCSGNTCGDGCCVGGRCMASTACLGTPDGGQPDAPLSGNDGNPGTGGGGGVAGTGGMTGTGGVVGTGGTTAPWTAPAGCGDGVVTSPERCDDGNTIPFDGCSSDCQVEPKCTGSGPCTSTCGDGIVVGEDCDDGNNADGDGCSSGCKVEAGFVCEQPALGDRILVPVVYRDFKFHNPSDFESLVTGSSKAAPGMVNLDLDSDGKPVYANLPEPPGSVHVASTATFATWYRNTDTVNHATPTKMTLWDNHNGAYVNRWGAGGEQWPVTQTAFFCGTSGSESVDGDGNTIPCTYKYSTGNYTDCEKMAALGYTRLTCILYNGTYQASFALAYVDGNPLFFPVDGDAFSASDRTYAQIPSDPKGMYDASGTWPHDTDASGKDVLHNFSFTSEFRYWFKYEAGMSYTLDIAGDDDVWAFVNKRLAVDLGGIHTPVPGSVTLNDTTAASYGLEPGNVYEVAVFQAERQSTSSTFKITLAGFNLAPSQCRRQ